MSIMMINKLLSSFVNILFYILYISIHIKQPKAFISLSGMKCDIVSAASASLQVNWHKGHLLIYPDLYVVHSFEQ